MYFNEMELIQKQWMSHEDRQVLESKGASKRPPKKQLSLGTHQGLGVFCSALQQTLFSFFFMGFIVCTADGYKLTLLCSCSFDMVNPE